MINNIPNHLTMMSSQELLQAHLANRTSHIHVKSMDELRLEAQGLVKTDETNDFSTVLTNEMDQLTKQADMAELASVLDESVLGTMSSESLSSLSNDILNASGGRAVLENLIDGHFQGMIFGGDDTSDKTADAMSQSVSSSLQVGNDYSNTSL